MKKIVLIGASGFVGSAIMNEALNRGHEVIAVVRNPEKIEVKNPNLKVVKADVSKKEELIAILKDGDTLISAYNPGWNNPKMYEETLEVYPTILQAAKEAGLKRILIVGGAGTLFVAPGVRVVDTGVIPEAILPGVKALGEFYLNTLENEKDIDWIFFSPAGEFIQGEGKGKFRLGKDDLIIGENGKSEISVQDYAKAMVDELESPQHHYERFTIGY